MGNLHEPSVENKALTASDLKYILEVNKKSIEINIEVEKQNEQVLESLEEFEELASKNEEKLDELCARLEKIDNNLFKLIVLLSGSGIGLIINIIQTFIKK